MGTVGFHRCPFVCAEVSISLFIRAHLVASDRNPLRMLRPKRGTSLYGAPGAQGRNELSSGLSLFFVFVLGVVVSN